MQVQMVRDRLTFEQSSERNHAEIRGRVFQAENRTDAKALRLDCICCV